MSMETLEFEVANRIRLGLLPLGDAACTISRQLQDRGFRAYLPYREFQEAFGNADDIRIHRLCRREQTKMLLSKPSGVRVTPEQMVQIYSSKLLADLRAELYREFGVASHEELRVKYPNEIWRTYTDPCQRKKLLAWQREGMSFELRREAVRDEINSIISVESAREAKRRTNRPPFDPKGRVAFYKELMGQYAGGQGFHRDARQSRGNYLVFSKPVLGDWSLCLVLEDAKKLSLGPFKGLCEPRLKLRHNSCRGEPESIGKCISIDHHVVIYGFEVSYWEFHDFDELELHVAAHVFLYGLCSEIIESAVRNGLASGIP